MGRLTRSRGGLSRHGVGEGAAHEEQMRAEPQRCGEGTGAAGDRSGRWSETAAAGDSCSRGQLRPV